MVRSGDYTRVWLPDKKKGWVPALLIKELYDGSTYSVKRIVDGGGSFGQEGEVEEVGLMSFGEEELGGWDISDGLPLMASVFVKIKNKIVIGVLRPGLGGFFSFLVSLLLVSASAGFLWCIIRPAASRLLEDLSYSKCIPSLRMKTPDPREYLIWSIWASCTNQVWFIC